MINEQQQREEEASIGDLPVSDEVEERRAIENEIFDSIEVGEHEGDQVEKEQQYEHDSEKEQENYNTVNGNNKQHFMHI